MKIFSIKILKSIQLTALMFWSMGKFFVRYDENGWKRLLTCPKNEKKSSFDRLWLLWMRELIANCPLFKRYIRKWPIWVNWTVLAYAVDNKHGFVCVKRWKIQFNQVRIKIYAQEFSLQHFRIPKGNGFHCYFYAINSYFDFFNFCSAHLAGFNKQSVSSFLLNQFMFVMLPRRFV